MAVLHDELTAAAEKSLVTILPNASQGDVNWAIGALPAIAPWNWQNVVFIIAHNATACICNVQFDEYLMEIDFLTD